MLHDHHYVLLILEHFVEPDYVRVSDLLQYVDLLEHLFPTVLVLELPQLDHFDRDKLSSQFVDRQVDFAECALANLVDESVEVQVGRREPVELAHVRLDVADYLVAVLTDFLVQPEQLILVDMNCLLVDGPDCRAARVASLVSWLTLRTAGVAECLEVGVLGCLSASFNVRLVAGGLQELLHSVLLLVTPAAALLGLTRQILETIRVLGRLQLLRLPNDHLVRSLLGLLRSVVVHRRIDV